MKSLFLGASVVLFASFSFACSHGKTAGNADSSVKSCAKGCGCSMKDKKSCSCNSNKGSCDHGDKKKS